MGPALLLAAAALALSEPVPEDAGGGGPPGGGRLRLLFTPPRCRLRCSGSGGCARECPNGDPEAVESGVPPPAGSGFRLVLCPLLCQNGGVCARPGSCLCPPHFTGRYCHVPANGSRGGALSPELGGPGTRGGPQALT
ncbi:latent-transforming growth factor beta-binding protein 3-like, partial [Pezoporus flaviventris]|uniref:latent-transforming growth factor beta-binding protein 3-like n=1 Tax=Pezoporus flaviventris TaxID=889875 RepID=UPI002AAFB112